MKLLREFQQEAEATNKRIREEHRDKCKALLESCADTPLFVAEHDYDKTNYESCRDRIRLMLVTGQAQLFNLACNHCGTQLVNPEPGTMLMSYPPQKRIGCPGCGWLGSTSNWA